MATGTILLPILGATPDPTAPPALKFTTTNNRPYLAFDSTTDEQVVWTFRMPENYASAPVLKIEWSGSSSTTTSHTVVWQVNIMASTGDTDGAIDAESFDTGVNVVSDDILGTTAKRHQSASITISNADSLAASDYVAVKLRRDADDTNGTDDLTEDAWLWAVSLEYTTS